MGYSPWGQKESDTNEQLTFSLSYNVITATAGQSSVVIRGKAVRGKKGPMTLFQGDTVHKDVWEEKALMDFGNCWLSFFFFSPIPQTAFQRES